MKCLGGGDVPRMTFDDEFFTWWDQKIIAVDDYPYAGMDFGGDPDLVLPPNATWGDRGNNFLSFNQFLRFFCFLNMKMNLEIFFMGQNTDKMLIFQMWVQ